MRSALRPLFCIGLAITPAFSQLSPEKERAIGKGLSIQMDREMPPVPDVEVTAYLNGLLGKLSQGVSLSKPFQLKFVESSNVIASALPGGFLILSSGALQHAETEAELAGLLAHALAHSQEPTTFTAVTPSSASIPVVFVGTSNGLCFRAAINLTPAGISEDRAEREADVDAAALMLLVKAGYDPEALVTAFDRSPAEQFPIRDFIRNQARKLQQAHPNSIEDTGKFREMKARVAQPAKPAPSFRRGA